MPPWVRYALAEHLTPGGGMVAVTASAVPTHPTAATSGEAELVP